MSLIIIIVGLGLAGYVYWSSYGGKKNPVKKIMPDGYDRLLESNPHFKNLHDIRISNGFDKKINFDLKGVHTQSIRAYFDSDAVYTYMQVMILPEPNNPKDPNALVVKHEKKKIGYVPSSLTSKLEPIIDAGYVAYINNYVWDDEDSDYPFLFVYVSIEY